MSVVQLFICNFGVETDAIKPPSAHILLSYTSRKEKNKVVEGNIVSQIFIGLSHI